MKEILRGVAVCPAMMALQIDYKRRLRNEGIARGYANSVKVLVWLPSGLTAVVLAITTYLGDMGLFGFFTVFTAIFAVLFGWTIASWMRAFVCLIICHNYPPSENARCFTNIVGLEIRTVKV